MDEVKITVILFFVIKSDDTGDIIRYKNVMELGVDTNDTI
jgi:hypothetical protein